MFTTRISLHNTLCVGSTLALAAGLILCQTDRADAYEIGRTSRDYADSDRASRSVPTDIFYPADLGGVDVPVSEGLFPTVSFGHGFLIDSDRYVYLAEALAGAGIIVALPNTEGGLFPNHGSFGLDLAFVLRAIEADGESAGSLLFGHVAGPRAVLGHSMGGGASFLAADSDPEIDALANLAAAETNPSAIDAASRLGIPALLLAGSEDCVTPPSQHQIPMYEALASDCRTLATLIGGSHCQFAQSGSVCELGEIGCGTPGMTREVQHSAVIELLAPWLLSQLAVEPGAWDVFLTRLQGDDIDFMQDCEVASVPLPSASSMFEIRIHPNPVRSGETISFDWDLAAQPVNRLELLDATGRVVRRHDLGSAPAGEMIRWRVADPALPAGSYWILAKAGSESVGRGSLRLIR